MIIRSFKARTIEEAKAMIRGSLGPGALIIQVRPIKQGGIFGLMGSGAVEVVAASDADDDGGEGRTQGSSLRGFHRGAERTPDRNEAGSIAEASGEPRFLEAIRREAAATAAMPASVAVTSSFRRLHDRLVEQGVLPKLARALVEEAVCRFPSSPFAEKFPNVADRLESASREDVLQALTGAVAKTVRVERSAKPASGPKVIALVGPTGVGKTTTIAKLASIAKLRHGLSTALATIDTYRIGAVDQLRTYAELLAVPLAVVQRPEQMKQAMESFSDKAVVFVDTIGRSPRDEERVNSLRPFFDRLPNLETHLVVSCTAKHEDVLLAHGAFSRLPLKRLIFSKVDEAASFGPVYNLADQSQVPLSYLTVGQEVPDDIEVTTPGRMAELMMR